MHEGARQTWRTVRVEETELLVPSLGEMNIHTNREGVRDGLRAMGDYHEPEGSGDYAHTFQAACDFVDGKFPSNRPRYEGTVIYGTCGYHRYRIGQDGSVTFSRDHARQATSIERAKRLGFVVNEPS